MTMEYHTVRLPLFDGAGEGFHQCWMWWGMSGWGWLWALISLALATILVAAVLYLVFKFFQRESGRDEALRILRERLARGEISEEEYERLRRKLES